MIGTFAKENRSYLPKKIFLFWKRSIFPFWKLSYLPYPFPFWKCYFIFLKTALFSLSCPLFGILSYPFFPCWNPLEPYPPLFGALSFPKALLGAPIPF